MKNTLFRAPDNAFTLNQAKSLPQEPIKEGAWLQPCDFSGRS
jgi:hypothetical protein